MCVLRFQWMVFGALWFTAVPNKYNQFVAHHCQCNIIIWMNTRHDRTRSHHNREERRKKNRFCIVRVCQCHKSFIINIEQIANMPHAHIARLRTILNLPVVPLRQWRVSSGDFFVVTGDVRLCVRADDTRCPMRRTLTRNSHTRNKQIILLAHAYDAFETCVDMRSQGRPSSRPYECISREENKTKKNNNGTLLLVSNYGCVCLVTFIIGDLFLSFPCSSNTNTEEYEAYAFHVIRVHKNNETHQHKIVRKQNSKKKQKKNDF